MKLKFLLLMTVMVILLTLALVIPLTQFEIYTLTRLSQNSTVTTLSILAYNTAGNFYKYYTGKNEGEIRDFQINLQDSLGPSKNFWKEAEYITVIDRAGKIIASTKIDDINQIYTGYNSIPEFNNAIINEIEKYNKRLISVPLEIEKINQKIKRINVKMDRLNSQSNQKKNTYLAKITDYQKKIEQLTINSKMAEYALEKIKLTPLNGLTEPVFINDAASYTIFYPIILVDFGSKVTSYGTIIASISTNFINHIINQILIISGIIAFIVLVISILIIQFYMKIIVQPIIFLTDAVKRIASGNLDLKVPVAGKDEIAILGNEFNNMINIWREKLLMEKYVSKSTVSMIRKAQTGELNHKESQRYNITVFFSDIRKFTSYAEIHDPGKVSEDLNAIFDIQVEIIVKNNGDIDKFVGDEIMAIFPHPADAFNAAIEIQNEMKNFNDNREEKLEVGIGINHGEAIMGSIGSGNHYNWTAIGDTVNIAARLCSNAEEGKILISENAFDMIDKNQESIKELIQSVTNNLSSIQVKGKQNSIQVYIF